MMIRTIEKKDYIRVGYITNELHIPEDKRMKCMEQERPEFYDTWDRVETALHNYVWNPDETTLELSIERMEIVHLAREVERFNFIGHLSLNGKSVEYKMKGVRIGEDPRLTRAMYVMTMEAEKYVQGVRAQQNLWDTEPVGTFHDMGEYDAPPQVSTLPPSLPGKGTV